MTIFNGRGGFIWINKRPCITQVCYYGDTNSEGKYIAWVHYVDPDDDFIICADSEEEIFVAIEKIRHSMEEIRKIMDGIRGK
jgi:hypothetical protein